MQFELNFKGLELLLFILWSKIICSSFAELFSVSVHNKTVFQCMPLHYNKMGSNILWNHIQILNSQQFHDIFSFKVNDWKFKTVLDIAGAYIKYINVLSSDLHRIICQIKGKTTKIVAARNRLQFQKSLKPTVYDFGVY